MGVMVKVWLPPEPTLTLPEGEMEPPAPAEAVIVDDVDPEKEAPTVRLPLMVIVQVGCVPLHAPVHPVKVAPVAGVAVRVTTVPIGNLVPVGLVATVPEPVPDSVTVSASDAKGANFWMVLLHSSPAYT